MQTVYSIFCPFSHFFPWLPSNKRYPRHLNHLLVGLLTLWSTAGYTQSPPPVTYRNPVIAGDFADPSVIRVGDTYYAAGTSSEWGPAYPLYTSQDLVNWHYLGPVFQKLPGWTMGSYWAPELFYRKGIFYVYYTARRRSDQHSYIGVATSRDPSQGFTDHGLLLEWTNEAIDAFVLEDNGQLYITWKAYGLDQGKSIQILGRKLTPDGLNVSGEVFTLLEADPHTWEAGGMEGQALFKRGRYYYMAYSGNTCCGPDCNYQVGFARAERLQGPWEKFAGNPVLQGDPNWKCPGHGTVVTTTDNRYFYLHHAYKGTSFTATGREGLLSELVWNDTTDWPHFRYGTTPPVEAPSPFGKVQRQNGNLSTDFGKESGPLPWVWDVSQPIPAFRVQAGHLQVDAPSATSPVGSFLGLVVRKGSYAFSADILPQSQTLQSVCVYGDAANAIGLGVNKDSLELWQVQEGKRQVIQRYALPTGQTPIRLTVTHQPDKPYQFSWQRLKEKPGVATPLLLEGGFLPRWDRAPRIGISVQAASTLR